MIASLLRAPLAAGVPTPGEHIATRPRKEGAEAFRGRRERVAHFYSKYVAAATAYAERAHQ
jgi:hypothetical protein